MSGVGLTTRVQHLTLFRMAQGLCRPPFLELVERGLWVCALTPSTGPLLREMGMVMSRHNGMAQSDRTRTLRHLHELIAALDSRVPHVERVGEIAIAREGRALREKALQRIAELEGEPQQEPDPPHTTLDSDTVDAAKRQLARRLGF